MEVLEKREVAIMDVLAEGSGYGMNPILTTAKNVFFFPSSCSSILAWTNLVWLGRGWRNKIKMVNFWEYRNWAME